MDFDYFYNREAERFNFLKVPEILVDGEEFKGLSAEAIILYSMFLKRTGMSFKNNWIDKEGRVFIYFTVEEIMRRRNISKPTAIKTLDELDSKKGIGLIERVRLGLGKPNPKVMRGIRYIVIAQLTEKKVIFQRTLSTFALVFMSMIVPMRFFMAGVLMASLFSMRFFYLSSV